MEGEQVDQLNYNDNESNNDFTPEEMRGSLGIRNVNEKILRSSISYSEKSIEGSNLRGSIGFRSSISTTISMRGSQGNFTRCSSNEEIPFIDKDNYSATSQIVNPNLRGSGGGFSRVSANTQIDDLLNPTSNLKASTLTTDKYKYIGMINSEGKRDGFGICYYQNGDLYTGTWKNDKKEGWGKYVFKSTEKTFHGEFKNNQIEGFVEYTNKCGVIHQGVMKNYKFVNKEAMIIIHPKYEFNGVMEFNTNINKLMGIACIKYNNGTYYEGEIIENYEYGWGITRRLDNCLIRGLKKEEGKYNSYCEIEYPDGEKFFGWFDKNKRSGIGITLSTEGCYCIGKFLDDYKDGAFFSCLRGEAKLELYHFGFLSKTIEKKENILNYLCLVYPEYRWICKTNNKLLAKMLFKTEKIN